MWKPKPDPDWLLRISSFLGPRKPQPVLLGAMVGGILGVLAVDDAGGLVFGMVIGGFATFFYRQFK